MGEPLADAAAEVLSDLVVMAHEGDPERLAAAGRMLNTLSKGQLIALLVASAALLAQQIEVAADDSGTSFVDYVREKAGG